METVNFSTNLKCNGCIAAVKPSLEAIEGLSSWSVDLNSPDKLLTAEVASDQVTGSIVEAFKKAGYEANQK